MPVVPFHNAGGLGFVPDLPAHELPPEAWSYVRNIRFRDNHAEKFLGHTETFGTPGVAPYLLLTLRDAGVLYWLYAGLAAIYVTDGTTHKNISKGGGYSATELLGWTGGVMGGVPILNNTVDNPQMWSPLDFSTPGLMSDITAWPANTKAKVVRPYQSYLVALNITKSGTEYPHLVKWSHQAESGSAPSSWDETDETVDAGENTLSETSGHLVDCLPLRDVNIIYKEDSIWGMQYIGGIFVFRFGGISKTTGAMSRRCMSAVKGRHVVFGYDDIVAHDTQNVDSIVDRRTKTWLYNNLDGDNAKLTFVIPHLRKKEMWFCFPETGEARATLAAVWDYDGNTWGVRELPEGYSDIAYEILDTSALPAIDTFTQTIDSADFVYNSREFDAASRGLLAADPGNTKFYRMEDSNTFNGTTMTATLERTGLAIIGQDRMGQPKVDFDVVKFVRAVRPRMSATGPVNVYVGSQMDRLDSVTWSDPVAFNPNTDFEAHFGVSGRLIAVRFESASDVSWELYGYDLDMEVTARY